MSTITTKQADYITSLRGDFTPDQTITTRNAQALIDALRDEFIIAQPGRARAVYGMDTTTARGRVMAHKAEDAYTDHFHSLTDEQIDAVHAELSEAARTFAQERITEITWAQHTDLDTMTKEDASRAIDILNRTDFIVVEDLQDRLRDELVRQFIAWYAAQ